MSYFCHQISFTTSGWSRLLRNSQEPFETVRGPIESLGGKVLSAFFALDSYDVLVLSDFPEWVSVSAIDIALFADGDVARVHSSQLLTDAQVLTAFANTDDSSDRTTPHALAATAT
jgi:uncharacterized protein with GYD domain